jgi:hypothetical protein
MCVKGANFGVKGASRVSGALGTLGALDLTSA